MCVMQHDETLPACDHAWDYRVGATVIRARLPVFISPVPIPALDFCNTTIQRVILSLIPVSLVSQRQPSLNSARFELCTFDALSKRAVTSAADQETYVGCVIPECCGLDASPEAAPGATHPEIAPLLHEFTDKKQLNMRNRLHAVPNHLQLKKKLK